MKLNRRNALIGLGSIAVGGGVLAGAGAFTQVEASRSMTVQFSDDSAAELGLSATSAYATLGTGTNGQQILQLEFSNLNDDAVSEFDGVFSIDNNDSDGNAHDVWIQSSGDIDGTKIDFEDSGNNSIVGSAQSITISNGASESIGVTIDSTNSISSSQTVTIIAN